MLDKTKKIIYIILGTLSIISIVFMLMHKVGLCAPAGYTDYPLPYGPGSRIGYGSYDLTEQNISDVVQLALSYQPTWFTDGYIVTVNEVDETNNTIKLRVAGVTSGTTEVVVDFRGDTDIFSSSSSIGLQRNKVLEYRINADSTITRTYSGSGNSTQYAQIGGHIQIDTTSREIYIPYDVFIGNYPVAFSDNLSLSYNGFVIFANGSGDSNFNGDDYEFPGFDSLPNSPSSGDSDYNLYQWLNGQNRNGYDYTKSIFDLTKGFFTWVSSPLDEDYVISTIENTTEYQVYDSISTGISSSFNMFDVAPAERIVIPISFANTPFSYVPDTEFNFDWYSGNVKTIFQAVLTVFMTLTFLFIFLKSIPNIIQGGSNIHSLVERTGKTK